MLNYILENKESLISIATSVVAVASAICALTPTPKDDGIVRKLYLVLEWAALNIGKSKE
jgi:hypothetical protein